ncbi:hypothetical protein RI129_001447 [Pyrocoelia pectoralis]|uniref:Regulatory protein zeste n=1 Tax=Pyrocoelia pectoralis TaxID=417401 RepID=A0AAN7VVJ6_9COLE
MNSKIKRTTYSDSELDLVYKYKTVVECKKTDVTTWKEKVRLDLYSSYFFSITNEIFKDTVWTKIANEFNCAATEGKTAEQLRTKYDNIKKEARKYFAKQKQELYRTGGGAININIRDVLKDIFEKIRAIINLSVEGISPSIGDSDALNLTEASEMGTNEEFSDVFLINSSAPNPQLDIVEEPQPHCSKDVKDSPTIIECGELTDVADWSTYKPAMLKKRKHKLLSSSSADKSSKSKYDIPTKKLCEVATAKSELAHLKKELLIKEDKRKEELHKQQIEIAILKKEHLKLHNDLLQLQIKK